MSEQDKRTTEDDPFGIAEWVYPGGPGGDVFWEPDDDPPQPIWGPVTPGPPSPS